MSNQYLTTNLEDIPVMCVVSNDGVRSAPKTISALESKLPTLRGRKFYCTLQGAPEDGTYKACVKLIPEDDPKTMGLETWIIPGGKYARTKVKGWHENIAIIGDTFKAIEKEFESDLTRPYIEFYRSSKELILFLPIK